MTSPARLVELCSFCRRTEARCTCEGAYDPVSVELSSTQQLSRGGTVQARSVAPRPSAGRRQRTVRQPMPPSPNVVEEVWVRSAEQALDTATPENLAGPHQYVNGVWFTYLKGAGWVPTTDT